MAFVLSAASGEVTSIQYLDAARRLVLEPKQPEGHYFRRSETGVGRLAGQL
jgi:hypothetical protein